MEIIAGRQLLYTTKVNDPKYYKHLKRGAYQSHLGRLKKGRLACTSSKTEILNKIRI